ncbi:CPBP family intramembrane glutamic endopeptidase [Vagococcus elongatus]|uniref:CAAX prenyl protease 2/Lysostaphin resistance protein A-like domain-containing protein n=1 Tax=Vagococcus elongatus TaxID=180344 RepID=A0A430B478_9ENTE|nr:type II CAAX endopeptidase family protein [Vagococcus elongatus]RSU15166.1 hypothetical protein CBF29_02195 [Vagococcus elongatus]
MLETKSIALTRQQRTGRWWTPFFWGIMLMIAQSLLVMAAAFVFGLLYVFFKGPLPNQADFLSSNIFFMLNLLSFSVLAGVTLLFCKKVEKRSVQSLGFFKDRFVFHYTAGLGIGFLEILLVVFGCLMLGSLSIKVNDAINWGMIVLLFLGFAVQGWTEEVLCRGFIMNAIASKKGVWFGIIGNSLFFSFLHGMNPGITVLALVNLFIFGVMFSLLFYFSDNIWFVGAAHSVWNFMLGPVLGIEVSGQKISASIFITELSEGKDLINGGSFGLEGGLVCTVVGLGICGVLYYLIKKRADNNHKDGRLFQN